MNVSLYLDRGSWVHHLDGRTKALSILGLFALTLVFSDPFYLIGVTLLVMLGVVVSRSAANVRKIWILLVLLFVYSALLWPFFVVGQTSFLKIGNFVLTQESIAFGVGMGLRLDLMVISGLLLLSTTTVEDFAFALQRLGLPSSMGFAFSLAFRWIPTLLGAGATVVQAQRSRGLDLSSKSIIGKIRQYPPLVVPLIGHSLRQTTLLAMALESKGFSPGRRRMSYPKSSLRLADYGILMVMAICVGVTVWLRLNDCGVVDVRF